MIKVEVAFATPEKQVVLTLKVREGCTVKEAILLSGIQQAFPEIDVNILPVGIFGKAVSPTLPLKENDRIELYRPLTIDPKEARRTKAKKNPLKKRH